VPPRYKGQRWKSEKQCFPLYSLLMALGNPTVDYFSLDVEGAELDILRTLPWDKVTGALAESVLKIMLMPELL
jgi:hypothetical protein